VGGPIFVLLFFVTLTAGAADRLAVLYFDATGLDRELEPLGRAVAEFLSADLRGGDGIDVVRRHERFGARADLDVRLGGAVDRPTALRLGERLDASLVVTGTLATTFDGVQIDAQLLDVGSGEVRESTSVAGPPEELGRLQHVVALRFLDALGRAASPGWPDWSLEQAIGVGREIDELEVAFRGRLESVEAYLEQRWVRRRLNVDHIGLDNQTTTWALFDGRGTAITPADAAMRVGDTDRLERMDQHRRTGRAIAGTSLALGVAGCAGTAAWSVTGPNPDDFRSGTPEYRRLQRRRFAWAVGCTVGAAVTLNGFAIGNRIWRKPRYPGYYWTPDEADEMLDEVNAQLAGKLGLTAADLEGVDRGE